MRGMPIMHLSDKLPRFEELTYIRCSKQCRYKLHLYHNNSKRKKDAIYLHPRDEMAPICSARIKLQTISLFAVQMYTCASHRELETAVLCTFSILAN